MNDNTQRIEQFRAEVADMKLRDPATGLDRLLVRLGVVGLVTGLGFGVAAWFISHGTRNPLQQRDAIVVGPARADASPWSAAALFVKGAMAGSCASGWPASATSSRRRPTASPRRWPRPTATAATSDERAAVG